MADLSELPHQERARRYREMASQARLEAEHAEEDVRDDLLRMAASWDCLADTVDAVAAHSIDVADEATQPGIDEKLAALKAPPTEPDET